MGVSRAPEIKAKKKREFLFSFHSTFVTIGWPPFAVYPSLYSIQLYLFVDNLIYAEHFQYITE